jgi:hypothetical protein
VSGLTLGELRVKVKPTGATIYTKSHVIELQSLIYPYVGCRKLRQSIFRYCEKESVGR